MKNAVSSPVTLVVGAFGVNCYLLIGSERRAIVIDPGGDADRILGEIERRELVVEACLLTHGHVDHLSAVPDLVARCGCGVYLHAADARWAFSRTNALEPYYSAPRQKPPDLRAVAEGDVLDLAGHRLRVLETPGHTPGGLCYYQEEQGILYTGDTLFAGSVGRTDFPGGDGAVLDQSLKRLMQLPPATVIYPGHGETSTLKVEGQTNPFLRL